MIYSMKITTIIVIFIIGNKMNIMEKLNLFISLVVSCNIKINLRSIFKKYFTYTITFLKNDFLIVLKKVLLKKKTVIGFFIIVIINCYVHLESLYIENILILENILTIFCILSNAIHANYFTIFLQTVNMVLAFSK